MSNEKITDIIVTRLDRIEDKLDAMQAHGCSKAPEQVEIKNSIRLLYDKVNSMRSELDQNKGKMVVSVAVVIFALNLLAKLVLEWIGKHI